MAIAFAYNVATNTVTVTGGTSGSPANLASFVTADRAGTGTSLLTAHAPASTLTLTHQVRPVELLALLISFVVAGKTAETDYIFVTGTDAWGNVQTESLDVSVGNGTYVTTKRFKTITNIDCSDNPAGGGTVWANGTLSVTQPIWGVIWDKGAGQYQLDSYFNVGDGTLSTYFADYSKDIYIYMAVSYTTIISVKANATFRLGVIIDETDKVTASGCRLYALLGSYDNIISGSVSSTATILLYSCLLESNNISFVTDIINANSRIWNTLLTKNVTLQTLLKGDYYNIQIDNPNLAINIMGTLAVFNSIRINNANCGFSCNQESIVRNAILQNCAVTYYINTGSFSAYLVDSIVDSWAFNFGAGFSGKVYRQYSFDLHIVDKNGVAISGAAVSLKQADLTEVVNTTTGADGKISQQTITRGYYDYTHGNTLQDYGPHTLTITRTGYGTYTGILTVDRKLDLEIELADYVDPKKICAFIRRGRG